MKPKEKRQFDIWYEEKIRLGYVFDLKQELINYCINDVTILRKAIVQFDQIIFDQVEFHPFKQCFTLPSLSVTIFRKKHVTEVFEIDFKYKGSNDLQKCLGYQRNGVLKLEIGDQMVTITSRCPIKIVNKQFLHSFIGVIPAQGYRRNNKPFSRKSIAWFRYLEIKNGIKILHAENHQEVRIRKPDGGIIYVDGYYLGVDNPIPEMNDIISNVPEGAIAFQYMGCLFHACRNCYKKDRHSILFKSNGLSYDEVYSKTEMDLTILRLIGLKVEVIWEHEHDDLMNSDTLAAELYSSLVIEPPLEI